MHKHQMRKTQTHSFASPAGPDPFNYMIQIKNKETNKAIFVQKPNTVWINNNNHHQSLIPPLLG